MCTVERETDKVTLQRALVLSFGYLIFKINNNASVKLRRVFRRYTLDENQRN